MRGGIGVQREGASPNWRTGSFGASTVRLVIPHWWDGREYLDGLKDLGLQVFAVMDRDAFSDWGDWRRSAEDDFARVDELYVKTGLISLLGLGNEFDDGWRGPGMNDDPAVESRGGVSSWVMSFAEQGEMIARAHEHFRVSGESHTRVPLVLGGSSSGQPAALEAFDLTKVSAVSLHPYGKRPSLDWPSPTWGFGYIGYWLDPVRQMLDARGLTDTCRIIIGELGLSSYDTDEGTQAEWHRRMLQYLQNRGDIDISYAFCDSDRNVDGYGGYRVTERPKLWVSVVQEVYGRLPRDGPLLLIPVAPVPPVEPPVEPEQPPVESEEPLQGSIWWDRHFTPQEIAQALADARTQLGRPTDPSEVIGEVLTYWPEFEPFMQAFGVADDPWCKIAILATLWVEVGWTFTPTDEIGDYNYFERMYGYQTSVGRMLGNLYPGDGARYRGRGYQLTGRSNYTHFGEVLGVDLVNNPEEANDPTLAAGAMVTFCGERGVFDQAKVGNWELVRKLYNGGLTGYDRFILAVNTLMQYANEDETQPIDQGWVREQLQKVLDEGMKHLGDPYVWDGERPGAFDCSGFVSYDYNEALGIKLTSYTDAIYDETQPLSEAQALPGDIVLFEYYDPSQQGVTFPHVGLVTDDPSVVLDARWGVGVGIHAHVAGAVRHYRRVKQLPRPNQEDDDEMVWKEKAEGLISALGYLGGDVADKLETARAKIDDFGDPPVLKPKKKNKPTKDELEAHAEAMQAWAQKVREQTDLSYQDIGAVGAEIRRVRQEFLG